MRMVARIGLLHGVAIGASALLCLKILTAVSGGTAAAQDLTPQPDPNGFAHVLSHARTNFEPRDVETTGSTGASTPSAAPAAASGSPKMAAPVPVPPKSFDAERAILEKLSERREELRAKAAEADERERLLGDAERRLDQRLEDAKALVKAPGAAAAERQADEDGAVKNLVVMYEAMKPKDAARVFDRLPEKVLVAVASQMKPRKMSEVLAAMNPAAAEKLTVALAGGSDPAVPSAMGLPAGELPAIGPGATARR